DELDAAALALARSIAERPPLAVRLVREHVQALAAAGVRGTLGRELVSQAMVVGSHDLREMREARAQDRPPRYERRGPAAGRPRRCAPWTTRPGVAPTPSAGPSGPPTGGGPCGSRWPGWRSSSPSCWWCRTTTASS